MILVDGCFGCDYVPHAGQKLHKTTISESQCNNNVRTGNVARLDVDQGQDESRERESRETERRGVGEVACRRAVRTGLEFSAKGLETHLRVVGCDVRERVAAVVIGSALLGDSAIVGVVHSGSAVVRGLLHAGAALIIN
jgi:hypothetical protein